MRSTAVFALLAVLYGAEATACRDYNASHCPTGVGCKVTDGTCNTGECEDYLEENCPISTGCIVEGTKCALDLDVTKGCSEYTAGACPNETGCFVEGGSCILLVKKGCTEYATNDTCSADSMCIFRDTEMCEYKKCADYTAATCPTTADDLCTVRTNVCKTKGCSDYSVATCPTTTGCVVESNECTLPGGGASGCTLDWRMGCSDYTTECCPTSTGCAVVGGKCALDVPGASCTLKPGYGCSDYTYDCCPVNTGCMKMNNACMLPGSSSGCPTEILGCDGYAAACCPVSTGCAISVDGKCTYAAPAVQGMAPVTSDNRSSCMTTCPQPVSFDNQELVCTYFTCLQNTASCAPILAAVRGSSSFATVQCTCGRPAIANFLQALESQGSCSADVKLGDSVDMCKATGACKDALKAGIEALDSEDDCAMLKAHLTDATSDAQLQCAMDMAKGDGDGDGDSNGDGDGDSKGDGDGNGNSDKGTASVAPKAAQARQAFLAATPLLWLLCG